MSIKHFHQGLRQNLLRSWGRYNYSERGGGGGGGGGDMTENSKTSGYMQKKCLRHPILYNTFKHLRGFEDHGQSLEMIERTSKHIQWVSV